MLRRGVQHLIALVSVVAVQTVYAVTEPICVVCAEPTDSGLAVLHSNQAYVVHDYPCKSTWDRVAAEGRLEGLVGERILPGDPLFSEPLPEPRAYLPGNPVVWTVFLIGAMTLSGLLALLLGTALQRGPLASFVLGFCIPAVGMVLVPVLPEKQRNPSPQETL